MTKPLSLTILALCLIPALGTLSSCRKKPLELDKFDAVCTKIVKCDRDFGKIPKALTLQGKGVGDPKVACQKVFARMSKNKSYKAAAPQIIACIAAAKCEDVSLNHCFAKVIQSTMSAPVMP